MLQSWPSQAKPTSAPVLQSGPESKVQKALSSPRWPLHVENRFNRSSMVVELGQLMFQGAPAGGVLGHAASETVRLRRPRVMLKVDLKRSEAMLN